MHALVSVIKERDQNLFPWIKLTLMSDFIRHTEASPSSVGTNRAFLFELGQSKSQRGNP